MSHSRLALILAVLVAVAGEMRLAFADEPGFTLIAKAEPDEFYHGLGGTYYPLGQQPPDLVGQPKVNQAYVWSMVKGGDSIWFGTAANPVAAALGGITGLPVPLETDYNVFEFRKSQYPGVPPVLKIFLGDYRPPEIHRLGSNGEMQNVTPDHPLIAQTFGIRSAGATEDLILMGGPDLSQLGINLFAFDAVSGEFLGAKHLSEFSDIRRWINLNGNLYTGTLNTWTFRGAGSVLRWSGTKEAPFDYEVVGSLDNEVAGLCAHDGRLFAFTWSTLSQTIETLTGARSQNPSGVWMSPAIPAAGLQAAQSRAWTKVWNVSEYETDSVIARSLWMGAAASHDGHLVWGTIQIPGYGAQVLKEVYGLPGKPSLVLEAITNSFRPAALFRGRLDQRGRFQAELLYGDRTLQTFSKTGDQGTWTAVPNGMGAAKLGDAGFGERWNMYVWSLLPHAGRLWIGTFDMSFIFFGGRYVRGEPFPSTVGGDLLVMDRTDQPVTFVSRTGIGNIANNGIRDMLSDGETILLGTATSANLLTDPTDGLVEGGWEVKRLDPSAAVRLLGSSAAARRLDSRSLQQLLGQSPP